jgi:hypothetical protein
MKNPAFLTGKLVIFPSPTTSFVFYLFHSKVGCSELLGGLFE